MYTVLKDDGDWLQTIFLLSAESTVSEVLKYSDNIGSSSSKLFLLHAT
jgi:hypothetical protein